MPRATRLSALDRTFLTAESPTAHMHIGWASLFDPPPTGPRPTFADLRAHIQSRLARAPRLRQRLLEVPFGLNAPVWADDERFDIDRHVLHVKTKDLDALVDAAMSVPLERDRPLWELWISERLSDGRMAVVGKVHHCLADGLAAVELGSALLDFTPDPPPMDQDGWRPEPQPSAMKRIADGLVDHARSDLGMLALGASLMSSPRRSAHAAAQAAAMLARAMLPPAPPCSTFNEPISPLRHVARVQRPINHLVAIKRLHSVTLNDVVLAACTGAMRSFLIDHGEEPVRLKAMVPVSVRDPEDSLGNRISLLLMSLPLDEPDPKRRLDEIHAATVLRKEAGDPRVGDATLTALGFTPQPLQRALTRMLMSPRSFNLVISNIPGPREPMWMRGCELREIYPVVPVADGHALAIGITTVRDTACFGLYADRKSLPDAQALADRIGTEIDEMLRGPSPPRPSRRKRFERPAAESLITTVRQ